MFQVAQIREELEARNADTRGIKKVIAERLFSLLQDEAEQLRQSRKATAASPLPEKQPKAPPRPRRTAAQMAEKLQLRSTSEPAKRAKKASQKDRAPVSKPIPEQLPGARAAQLVRLAMMSKIAKASMVSAQQKQQQEAQIQTAVQPGTLPKQTKQRPAQQTKQSQRAQRGTSQLGGAPLTEVVWESDAPPSSANPQAQQKPVAVPNPAAEVQSPSGSQGASGAAHDVIPQACLHTVLFATWSMLA